MKRGRCHHFTFPPKAFGLFSRDGIDLLAAVLAYHPFDTVVRRYAIIRPSACLRSRVDNYVSRAAINRSISVYIRRSDGMSKLSYPTGSLTEFTTLMCVICHTGPAAVFPAVMPVNRYKASYRTVIVVICRTIEADGTRVTTLVEAIRHTVLTHSRGSQGCRIGAGTIVRRRMRPFPGVLIAYF